MIKKMALASVLLAICLFTLSASPLQPKGWEYKFQYQCDEKKANKLADEGWELRISCRRILSEEAVPQLKEFKRLLQSVSRSFRSASQPSWHRTCPSRSD